MKKVIKSFLLLSLTLLTVILFTFNVFAENKDCESVEFNSYNLNEKDSSIANEGNKQDIEIEKKNKEIAKTIKDETGIEVEVKEGILSYDSEKSIAMRNNETAEVVKRVYGIDLEVTEGIIYIDREAEEQSNKYKLSEITLETVTKPDTLLSDYPYESRRLDVENHMYSKYLFKFNTEFSSNGKSLYHADFYNQNDLYICTISGINADDMYRISVNVYEGDTQGYPYNDSYYIIMYNDDNTSTTQDVYYNLNSNDLGDLGYKYLTSEEEIRLKKQEYQEIMGKINKEYGTEVRFCTELELENLRLYVDVENYGRIMDIPLDEYEEGLRVAVEDSIKANKEALEALSKYNEEDFTEWKPINRIGIQ